MNYLFTNRCLSNMKTTCHWISLTASFVAVFTTCYLLLDYTVGRLEFLHNWEVYRGVSGRSVIFSSIIITLIVRYVKFYSPYQQ
jgi:hypothetical protein